MIDLTEIDYSELDVPQVLSILFYPRPDFAAGSSQERALDLMIPVDEKIKISARFHPAGPQHPNILFFHGNGEIVADYDDLAPLFNEHVFNFLPVDYRGYGRSGGRPTITFMMRDAHVLFHFVRAWLGENGYQGPLIVMGRSLGSASALELAAHYPEKIDGLVVESGFARVEPLLALLGVNIKALNQKGAGFNHLQKIKKFTKPTMVIHAEYDHIIPFTEGQALFAAAGSPDKSFLKIPGANHNDIFAVGLNNYMKALERLAHTILEKPAP